MTPVDDGRDDASRWISGRRCCSAPSPALRFSSVCRSRARARSRRKSIALLNALAIGILLYLVVEIAQNATVPISQAAATLACRRGAVPGGARRRLRRRIARSVWSVSAAWRRTDDASARSRPRIRSCSPRSSRSASARITSAKAWRSALRPRPARPRSRSALIVGFGAAQRDRRVRRRGAAGRTSRSVVGADRPRRTDRRRPDVHRHDRRLHVLLADALGVLPRDRGRRAGLRHRRAVDRCCARTASTRW